MNQQFVQNVFDTIAKAGLGLLERHSGKPNGTKLVHLCEDLLSEKGEASGIALAWNVLQTYQSLKEAEKLEFFNYLESQLSPSIDEIQAKLDDYKLDQSDRNLRVLIGSVEPKRQELIGRMNMAPDGIYELVAMRRDLLAFTRDNPQLRAVDYDFKSKFASWFNRGFLNLKRIDWKTPANILEKLIAYESVHEIKNWDDLRRRLSKDRRCYAFYHPAFGLEEPLIFVEVALVNHLSDSVQSLLDLDATVGDPLKSNTAIFYSINNCQPGLKGISLGNFLIKQVVADLQAELPNLKTFSTLSPVPGLVSWIKKVAYSDEDTAIRVMAINCLDKFDQADDFNNDDTDSQLEMPIKQLCAHYLTKEKARDGSVLNPVARFHLGNGARLERINYMGDTSEKGMAESAGVMVNYLYDLNDIESNHEVFVKQSEVIMSNQIKPLLKIADR